MKLFGTVIWIGGVLFLFTSACQQTRPTQGNRNPDYQEGFHWLHSGRDATLWNSVQAAFRQELEPDDPAKLDPHRAAYEYKYLYQIGVFNNAALVIIGHRLTRTGPGDDWFNAYSYDLGTGTKREIIAEQHSRSGQSDALWEFDVIKLARFEPSPTPDVVFTYDGCTECEGDHFLASFRYDSASRTWTARPWDKESSLLLAFDPSPGDNVLSSEYLYKIKDWNGDGFDEVAVRRRKVTQVGKRRQETEDSTVIYGAEKGTLLGNPVIDSKEREGINAELCSDSDVTLCQQK